MSSADARSIPQLLDHALRQASELFSEEIALARAELSEKVARAGRGATMIAFGGLLAMPAIVVILIAIAMLLVGWGVEPWTAYLATGVGTLVLGVLLAWLGARRFSAEKLKPRATIEEIRRDRNAVREMVR